jgi:uncharacterized protein YkwD
MSRVRIAVLFAVLVTALAIPAGASANSRTMEMLAAVNAARAHYGLPALHYSRSLAHSAHSYSRRMMSSGYFGHDSRIHASRRYRTLGEILDYRRGMRPAVRATLRDWLNSPEHRSIIMSRGFTSAGAGYVRGRFRGVRSTLWTMHFGHR